MVDRLISRLQNTSLKNKFFFSTTLVILLISVPIALFTRWILISSLTTELQLRGLGIATSIADSSRGYLLTEDRPRLTSLIFDARLGERRLLVGYIFIQNKSGRVTAHTFTRPFPNGLAEANSLGRDESQNIRLVRLGGDALYDVAVPIREGIYHIGMVRVGLFKNHIDLLIGKLRTTFLGFLTVMILFCFLVSHRLSRYITRPISQLTQISDELSRGRFAAVEDLDRRFPAPAPDGGTRTPDEVRQLSASFLNMTRTILESRAQLMESEQKYRSLFVGGPNPVFVVDRETCRILDANPTALDVYGYGRDELLGLEFTRLGPFRFEGGGAHGPDSLETVTVSPKERFHRKGGMPIYVSIHASPARYDHRAALIVATTDITEMVEKDDMLIQFGKLKTLGEMSAGIAHELNQPLNAIRMGTEYLEMALERGMEAPRSDLEEVVGEIVRQVERAADIIQRLREFGRKSDFTRERISINRPVQSVVKILGRQLALQNIAVELELADAPPMILAHSNRLEQVVFNLLTNARDAIHQRAEQDPDAGNRIRIRTGEEKGRAVVVVADTGVGIPPGDRQRIFEAFFTTKEMGEGMGLGLSISNGIVEDYGGRIEVASRPGEGTTFTLSFPVSV